MISMLIDVVALISFIWIIVNIFLYFLRKKDDKKEFVGYRRKKKKNIITGFVIILAWILMTVIFNFLHSMTQPLPIQNLK